MNKYYVVKISKSGCVYFWNKKANEWSRYPAYAFLYSLRGAKIVRTRLQSDPSSSIYPKDCRIAYLDEKAEIVFLEV